MTPEHFLFGQTVARELTAADIPSLVADARRAQRRLEDVPLSELLNVLDRVAEVWRDPSYPPRQAVLKHMPEVVGFSEEMVVTALEALCDALSRGWMERKIKLELGGREALDGWRYVPSYQGYLRAQALGVVLHVSAGNVFVSGADSLAHGIITRNASLLKVSRADPLFPLLFARSIADCDPSGLVAGAVAVLSFRGGSTDIESALKSAVDGVVVWGGEDAVNAWRHGLPMGTRILSYGPKYSLAVVTSQGLLSGNLAEIARAAARDVVLWEQRACSSPQVIYVEDDVMADLFVDALVKSLDEASRELPQGVLSMDEQIELLKTRELARMAEAFGEARLLASPGSTAWTVIREASPEFRVSPLNRCVYVKVFQRWDDVVAQVTSRRGYVQSAAVLGSPRELKAMSTDLARAGVDRVTELGGMGVGRPGSPHDGTFQMHDLVRWVCIESVRQRFDLGEHLAPPGDQPKKWARLQDLAGYAREHSAFYRERLPEMAEYADFERVPFLERGDVYRHTPPQGSGLLTGELEHAYVFASGGSTGEPKFSFYTYDEFNEVTRILSEIYQVAGITSQDVVGNLFMAGNLWTSFIVANEALEKIGCVTLPIAGNADMGLIVRYLQLFRPTVLIGLPSIIIQLAETVKAQALSDVRVRMVLYGGEHVGAEARTFLSETLGCERIISAGYASVDAGPVGYQCPESPRTVHHLLYEYQYLEIIDPATGDVLPKGEVGEIVVTNLNRRLMPIIRFRTGDLGRRVEGDCPCGRTGPMFELLGRCDDVVRVGTVSVYPEEIESVLARVPGISHLFQIVAERAGTKDRLVIRTELPTSGGANGELSGAIRAALLENPELEEAVREGWIGELRVEVLPPGGIPRIKRTGKIRKVVDAREQSESALR